MRLTRVGQESVLPDLSTTLGSCTTPSGPRAKPPPWGPKSSWFRDEGGHSLWRLGGI